MEIERSKKPYWKQKSWTREKKNVELWFDQSEKKRIKKNGKWN